MKDVKCKFLMMLTSFAKKTIRCFVHWGSLSNWVSAVPIILPEYKLPFFSIETCFTVVFFDQEKI